MRSLPQAASGARHAVLQERMEMRREVGNCRRSPVELRVLHRVHARLRVQADSDAPGVVGDVHQDRAASAVDYSGSTKVVENRTALMTAAVKVGWLRACEVHLPAQDTEDARIQQYVLGVEREIEALTWEGMDNFVVQTCWD